MSESDSISVPRRVLELCFVFLANSLSSPVGREATIEQGRAAKQALGAILYPLGDAPSVARSPQIGPVKKHSWGCGYICRNHEHTCLNKGCNAVMKSNHEGRKYHGVKGSKKFSTRRVTGCPVKKG